MMSATGDMSERQGKRVVQWLSLTSFVEVDAYLLYTVCHSADRASDGIRRPELIERLFCVTAGPSNGFRLKRLCPSAHVCVDRRKRGQLKDRRMIMWMHGNPLPSDKGASASDELYEVFRLGGPGCHFLFGAKGEFELEGAQIINLAPPLRWPYGL
ncbi:hypothetical protein BD324DRAFT_194186 [Kockovaella imperatae]|uniref:Uncharacterized protein n=1 Tax=Kockovaella imperatae TaxID=4999 RepID=A0A1Y1UAF3_9TREE|nr:hypothetical protein BD324DRAFT_194186 [Kockovaella imperatae]ORX34055.1 hypothetical protein BD324DRAFT_194186 [Kockovaella imperatae]